MCGRYTLTTGWGEVANEFGLPEPLGANVTDQPPRFNIAPSQAVPVLAHHRVMNKAAVEGPEYLAAAV